MGTATAICTAAAVVTITDGAGAADTITAGAITVATTDPQGLRWTTAFVDPIAPTKASTGDMDGRADRRGQFSLQAVACQPSPISTAIRIRSEWFLAPSFCFSSEVVLATVL